MLNVLVQPILVGSLFHVGAMLVGFVAFALVCFPNFWLDNQ